MNSARHEAGSRPRRLLLIEQAVVMRQTIAMTASALHIGDVHQSSTVHHAMQLLDTTDFDGIVMSIDHEGAKESWDTEQELLRRIRDGETATRSNVPIVVLTATCDAELVSSLRDRHVGRILLKPIRVRTLLETLTEIYQKGTF